MNMQFWSHDNSCFYSCFNPEEDLVAVRDDDVTELLKRMTLHTFGESPPTICYGVERGVYDRYRSLRTFAARSVERNKARVRGLATVGECEELLCDVMRDFVTYKATGTQPENLVGEFVSVVRDADQFRTPQQLIEDMNTIHAAILQKYLRVRVQEICEMEGCF